MVVTLVKVEELRIISVKCFSDGARISDSSLMKFGVGAVLVDLLPRNRQGDVLVILPLHASITFVLTLVGLLPVRATRVGFDRSGIFEARIQLIL